MRVDSLNVTMVEKENTKILSSYIKFTVAHQLIILAAKQIIPSIKELAGGRFFKKYYPTTKGIKNISTKMGNICDETGIVCG